MMQRFFLILTGIWLGIILGVGYLVAPTLFISMADKQLAGQVAGEIFKHTAILTIVVTTVLLILANLFVKRGLGKYRSIRWLLLIIIVCAVVGVGLIQPWMASLKDLAEASGTTVALSEHAKTFGRLHGVSSILFMCEALLGLLMFWKTSKPGNE